MGAMLALSAIFAVVITSVTLTQERTLVEAQSGGTTVTVTIAADDGNEATANDDVITEGGSAATIVVSLNADLAANQNIPITVGATGDSATLTTDYTVGGLTNGELTILADNDDPAVNDSASFTITPADDDVSESQETLTVTIGTLPSGYSAGTPMSVTITINDDDADGDPNSNDQVAIRVATGRNSDGSYIYADLNNDNSINQSFVPKVGQMLVADTSGVTDVDNDANNDGDGDDDGEEPTFVYQWIRTNDGSTTADDTNVAIANATSSSYTLSDEDVGDQITVQVWSSDRYDNGNANASIAVTDGDVTVVAAGTNGQALVQPSQRGAVLYDEARPFIIVGALTSRGLAPTVVLTADTSGMFDSEGDLIDANGAKVDADDDTATTDDVLASELRLTWTRNGAAIVCDADGDGDTTNDDNTPEACAYTANISNITYTLTDADVSESITLVATYMGTKADDTTETRTHSTSDSAGTIISTNAATGKPEITGTTQVGSVLTANKGTIADADLLTNATYSYMWYHSNDMANSIGSGSTYVIKAGDAGKTFKVVASFMDDLGDPDMRTSDPTNMVAGSPGMISKIEPGIRDVVISGGEDVVLSVEVYGLQGKVDQSLADGVTLNWTTTGGSVPDDAAGNTEVTYTASSSPGTYTITAMVSDGDCQPDDESMREAACSASFEVRVRRSAPPQPEPAAPANPPGDIPTILTDSEGNQYEVFTPVEGGTFAGEGYSIVAGSGAVPNGEFIGVRMSDDGSASNAGMTHQRYTLGGNMYGVHAVDSTGASVSDYVLDEAAEVCVPLPDAFRARISDLALVTINSDGSLTILAANVRLGDGGDASVCGNLSNLPASVAVGSMGAPAAIPTATPVPTPVPPETGGSAPTSNGMLWVLVLGTATILLGATVALTTRRSRKSLS